MALFSLLAFSKKVSIKEAINKLIITREKIRWKDR